jgi:hypothetical protein
MRNIFPPPLNTVRTVAGVMRLGLLIGFGGMTCAWAGPLYQCPGMLFSNNLDPVQARAMGCEPMQPGRLSQAHNTPTAPSETSETDAPAADTVRPSSAPVALGTRKLAMPEPGPEVAKQRQRDSHAREIIQAELARTQAQMQSLSAQPPGADAQNALQRLRIDEAALLRELARRPG